MTTLDSDMKDLLDEFAEFQKKLQDSSKKKGIIVRKGRGNIAGLAKHLAKKYGGDPKFFTKCDACEELAGYDEEARHAICAKAHKLAVGKWPAEKKELETYVLTPEDADWMHSLPGYQDEVRIHEELSKSHSS